MKRYQGMLLGMLVAASASYAASDKALSIEEIVCFSDSAAGMEAAQAAARLLSDRGQGRYYSKSFVVTEREDKDSNRFLILILSPDGDKAFDTTRQGFDDSLLALLQKMKNFCGDTKISVILQRPDKSNMMEAYFDDKGAGALKGLSAPPKPPPAARSPSPHPLAASPVPVVGARAPKNSAPKK
ncbi:MAG: hypothetical protein WCP22_05185 [Chlamydiota bacterium]